MDKVILKYIDVTQAFKGSEISEAQRKINEYLVEKNLDVISVSMCKEDTNKYIFALTLR